MSDARPPNEGSAPSTRLVLYIEGIRRTTVTLQVAERLIVGRSDTDTGLKPGLDLAPFSGEASGVSRNHAAFSFRNGTVFVEDLGSTNGTRLNGLELISNDPYRLRDGDELEFGSIRVTVRSTTY